MKKNELVELEITDFGNDGEGIGKADGFAFFVKDTVPGDRIRASVMKLKKNYGFARLVEVLSPSKDRVEPVCEIARACGGCTLQAVSYARQLQYKEERVRSCLERIGGFENPTVEPILGMEEPFRYRNKAQYPVRTGHDGSFLTGFFAANTHSLVPVRDCFVCPEEFKPILDTILAWMNEEQNPPYDEKTQTGTIRHVLIRKGFATGELFVCIVANEIIRGGEALMFSLEKIKGLSGISVNYNSENTNVILGSKTASLWGKAYLTDRIGELTFQISPESFYQVNPVQTKRLYDMAKEYAGLTAEDTLWDLYCGIGTISLCLAKEAGRVFGVEVVPKAIENAKQNAVLNGMDHAAFFCGKAEEVYAGVDEKHRDPDHEVVILDPPRKGCDPSLLHTILKVSPKRIVYVSCDPATLARDLKILCEKTYRLEKVQPVDMFPQTGHVETVVMLTRVN